ncbi:MAG TPA: radical SAM protein [Gemmatimonadaceae bacterium]|nr:radical SAM protein [Gemmatimonadaceae bacterium]
MAMQQPALFPAAVERALRQLPVIGEQRDITYYGTYARTVLNGPATTGMSYWSINPYVGCAFGCAYCYARYAHRYVMERAAADDRLADALQQDATAMPPWLAFERHIFVKRNAPSRLRHTLRQGSDKHRALLEGEGIVIGTATDPYQPAERRFRVTRGILETLAEHPGLSIGIITKSPLITRDVDLLVRIARHSSLSIHLSLITLDRTLARRIEPRAPTPESRIRALRRLSAAGLSVGIFCMPVLPGITDDPRGLDALVRRVADAGAISVSACALRLQHEARKRYLPFIEQEFPHLAARYSRAYASSHELSARYRSGLSAFVHALCKRYGIRHSIERDRGAPETAAREDEQLLLEV